MEEENAEKPKSDLAELVQRSLLQLGEMTEIQMRLREVSERISRLTPVPVDPKQREDEDGKPDLKE